MGDEMLLPSTALIGLLALGQAPAEAPFVVETAAPLPALTRQFVRTEGWTGADGAATVRLAPDRLLWLFSDTWIGKVERGRRTKSRMVNNTVALQSLSDPKSPLSFHWDAAGKEPAALFRPDRPDRWYWLGTGAMARDKLYVFCKLVRRKEEGPPGFQFDWFGVELVRVANPLDAPEKWKAERCRLPEGDDMPRLSGACLVEGDHLYVYGLFPARAWKPLHRPMAVARIPLKKLAAAEGTGWQYWCRGERGGRWDDRSADLMPLFADGAPEFSVVRARGLDGYLAVYTPLGLGPTIVARHAPRPEGPWSKPLLLYRCPEAGEKLLLYAAKAHPDLAEHDGQLVLTYCRNAGSLAEHVRRPELYTPQGVEVRLKPLRRP